MTNTEFEAALAQLGWSQLEFASRTGSTTSTVNRWACGHAPLPKWAAAHIKILLLAKAMLA